MIANWRKMVAGKDSSARRCLDHSVEERVACGLLCADIVRTAYAGQVAKVAVQMGQVMIFQNRIVPGFPIPRPRMKGAQHALQSRQPQKPLGRATDLPLERLRKATRREADRPGDLMHGRAQFAEEDSVAQRKRRRHGRGHKRQTTSEPVANDALSGMEITGLEQWTNQTVVSSRVYGRQQNSTSGKARKLHSGQGHSATARQNGGKHRRRNIGPGGRWRENRPPRATRGAGPTPAKW